jgi:hypothetical protein
MTLAEIFPDEDYRFTLRFGRGEPAGFFAATSHHATLLAQRWHWLRAEPNTYAALVPEGVPLLEETTELAREWNGFAPSLGKLPWDECLALGEFWEADYLLLKADAAGEIRLLGGCLCFPSSWRLHEKLGRSIEDIHGVVPGLNANIGPAVHKFLAGLKPGVASLRHNWGLSRSPELNQHPDRSLPRLDATVRADEVWLRVEQQALVALPRSGGILFGIRIANHPLAEVKGDLLAGARLIRALETMPEAMAVYKGIAPARMRLLELLRN